MKRVNKIDHRYQKLVLKKKKKKNYRESPGSNQYFPSDFRIVKYKLFLRQQAKIKSNVTSFSRLNSAIFVTDRDKTVTDNKFEQKSTITFCSDMLSATVSIVKVYRQYKNSSKISNDFSTTIKRFCYNESIVNC